MKKAFAYIRVSSKGQTKGHGPERQREFIEACAQRNGCVIERYFEDAHTGADEDRPQYNAMVNEILANGVRTVIIESLDRFARDLGVQKKLLKVLVKIGVDLISADNSENITTSQKNRMGRLLTNVRGSVSEYVKDEWVERGRQARDAKSALLGKRCEGRKPFGESKDAEKRAKEQAALEEIRRLVSKKSLLPLLMADIAKLMNELEIKSPSGWLWSVAEVSRVINDNPLFNAMPKVAQEKFDRIRKAKTRRHRTLQEMCDVLNSKGFRRRNGKEWTVVRLSAIIEKYVRGKKGVRAG